jgi:molecular chaperone DnaJ
VLKVANHPVFERHDDDLYLQREITFTQAALGDKLKVPGLDGDLELEIPEGTQTGAVFRLLGKGVPHLEGRGRGDQYVIVKVVTPTDLSKEEKHLLREFEKLRQRRLRKEGETKHG